MGKKNATSGRAIAPPRRVSLAINKNGFKRKDVQLSTDDGRIIALSQLRGQDKNRQNLVHNLFIIVQFDKMAKEKCENAAK